MNYMTKPQLRRFDLVVKTLWQLGYLDGEIADVVGVNEHQAAISRRKQKLTAHRKLANEYRLWPLQDAPDSLWGVPIKDYIFKEESPVNVLEGVVTL